MINIILLGILLLTGWIIIKLAVGFLRFILMVVVLLILLGLGSMLQEKTIDATPVTQGTV